MIRTRFVAHPHLSAVGVAKAGGCAMALSLTERGRASGIGFATLQLGAFTGV
jgi:hypothetical protein